MRFFVPRREIGVLIEAFWEDLESGDLAVIISILCVSDALWVMVAGNFFGWW